MQRKRNTEGKQRYVRFKHYLHSIPKLFIMKDKVKSNVLCSIPTKLSNALYALLFGKGTSYSVNNVKQIPHHCRLTSSIYNSTNAIRWRSQNRIPFGAVNHVGGERKAELALAFPSQRPWRAKRYLTRASLAKLLTYSCILALLIGPSFSNYCYAIVAFDYTTDQQTTITPISSSTSVSPTTSLSISNSTLISDAVTPGDIATVSTDITVSVNNANSYSLTLSVNSATLTNGNTGANNTLTAGNVIADNTWGYKWDNDLTYTTPTTSGTTLTSSTNPTSGTALTNNAVNFTKTLTFGAKFGENASPGTYHGSGTVLLVATPNEAVITLADLTEMQQLSLTEAAGACENTPYLTGQNYSAEYELTDIRDGYKYSVRKLGDGKCWMTRNLALNDWHAGQSGASHAGRTLNSTTTDITASSWTLPASSTSGFSSDTASNAYLGTDGDGNSTGYYTWCAATAGTCSSATSSGAHASSSICPKGWRLPGGYGDATYGNEFYTLFNNMGLGITLNTTSSSTSWTTTQLNIVQGSPYYFAYTGHAESGKYNASSGSYNQYGNWWSSTAGSDTLAYRLYIYSSGVNPGSSRYNRYNGFAVRCIAR